MDDLIYDALSRYYHTLEVNGYMSYSQMQKLFVLCFYRDFVYNDFRGILTRDDYLLIEKALDCLYGTTCLIPYPDYLKMGKLHLGKFTELCNRVKVLEKTDVVKVIHDLTSVDANPESDIIITQEIDEEP